MCCLYFGSSREIFALLKSQRMIKTESGCFRFVSVICSVRLSSRSLAEECRHTRSEEHIFFNTVPSVHHLSLM